MRVGGLVPYTCTTSRTSTLPEKLLRSNISALALLKFQRQKLPPERDQHFPHRIILYKMSPLDALDLIEGHWYL